jgi:hypothetical protein
LHSEAITNAAGALSCVGAPKIQRKTEAWGCPENLKNTWGIIPFNNLKFFYKASYRKVHIATEIYPFKVIPTL